MKQHKLSPVAGVIRAKTRDNAFNMATLDAMSAAGMVPLDGYGNMRGRAFEHAYRTHDGAQADGTHRTVDSTGAFLVGELERLDQTLHLPLSAVTWSRDIDLRGDVTIADEVSSFTLTTFGSAGSLGTGQGVGNGKAWIGKATDQIGGVGVDTGKIPNPLTPWGLEVKFTILELESAAKMGRPIDDQKYQALKLKFNMDTDEQVYIGDTTLGVGGLLNNALVTNVSNVVADGTGSSPLWTSKTPAQILRDINDLLQSVWAASGWSTLPNRLLISPTAYGYINSQVVSSAGNMSILRFLLENNIVKASTGENITIAPCKWCIGSGAGGTIGTQNGKDRMAAYRKDSNFVRFPMTQLQRTPIQYDAIYHKMTYFARLGVVEVVYPETIGYRDAYA